MRPTALPLPAWGSSLRSECNTLDRGGKNGREKGKLLFSGGRRGRLFYFLMGRGSSKKWRPASEGKRPHLGETTLPPLRKGSGLESRDEKKRKKPHRKGD